MFAPASPCDDVVAQDFVVPFPAGSDQHQVLPGPFATEEQARYRRDPGWSRPNARNQQLQDLEHGYFPGKHEEAESRTCRSAELRWRWQRDQALQCGQPLLSPWLLIEESRRAFLPRGQAPPQTAAWLGRWIRQRR